MNNLNKLKKANEGWLYLWRLLEKEVVQSYPNKRVLAVLYKYQVELYSIKFKLKKIESVLNEFSLDKPEEEKISEALSLHIATFQSMAISIENLLEG